MPTFSRAFLASPFLFGLFLTGFFLAIFAQSAAAESARDKKLGLLLEYLAADFQIIEGVGLQKLRLGDPMSKAPGVFGSPKTGREVDTGQLVLEVTLDNNTRLRITGKNRIRNMSFKGNNLSQYKTRSGAGFGMPSYQISSIYGQPVLGKSGKTLAYPGKGIRFYFEKGLVSVIEVFPNTR